MAVPVRWSAGESVIAAGRAAWPALQIDEVELLRRLELLQLPEGDLALRGRDLFLGAACAMGAPGALEIFELEVLPSVELAVRRFGLDPATIDEVKQLVRVKLFSGERPRIGSYQGRGPLDAWVRMLAVRTAFDYLGSAQAGAAMAMPGIAEVVGRDETPEAATIAEHDRPVFQAALERAFSTLSAREKTILRLYFIDDLGVEGIGAVYHVHKATVSRWLLAIRTKIMDELHRILSFDLRLSPSELRSLTLHCWREVKLSLSRILGAPSAG
jgi:RNA polymerase sigma-70 factor (ECF subfamily)